MSYYSNNGKTVSPSRVKLHVPKITIASSEKTRSRSKSRESDDDGSGRGSIGKRIGAQFFVENTATAYSKPSINGFEGFEHLILHSVEERVPFTAGRLGDTYVSSSNLKTGILLEDNDIRASRTNSENGPDFDVIRDRDSIPSGLNVFEDTKMQARGKDYRPQVQDQLKKSTTLFDKPNPLASASSSVEEDLSYVTEQLQIIQETQDSILSSLRSDIEVVQTENTLLSQKNQQLQSQVSHLNQLVADLSMDLRQMRDIVRSKQALGVSLSLLHGKDPNYFKDDANSMVVDYTSSRNSTGNQTTPSIILSHAQTQMNHTSYNHARHRREPKEGHHHDPHEHHDHHRKSSRSRPGTAVSKQIPLNSKTTSHTMKTEKRSKKSLKENKSVSRKKTVGTLNGNDHASAYVESSMSKPMKSPGCFSKLFKSKKSNRKED